jgi:Patatin-like phospholipase
MYSYLLRVPLLAGVVAFWVFFYKADDWVKMLAGAFDQTTGWQVVFLTLVDILFLYTLVVTGQTVLAYSRLRGSAPAPSKSNKVDKAYRWIWTLLCWLFALPLLRTAWVYSAANMKLWKFILWGLAGAIFALLITTCVHAIRRWVVPKGHRKFKETLPFVLVSQSALKHLETEHGVPSFGPALLRWLARLPRQLTRGYITIPETGSDKPARLLPGHGLALAMLGVFSVVFGIVGYYHFGTAIVYVLLLLTLLCWIFSGVTFFFDRYRVPVVALAFVFFLITARFPQSDHYFPFAALPRDNETSDGEYVLAERPRAAERPIILISANGGGIQSAAWTARVLTGLAQMCKDQGELQKFLESIRLISGVSGGSVGTMFFVNEIRAPDSNRMMRLEKIVEEAEDSGLEELVWGLTYPDLAHALFPFFRCDLFLDRGHTLEEAWVKSAHEHGSPPLDVGLLDWTRGVIEGWRPATIFNATFVESGERLQISTIPVRDKKPSHGRREFYDLYDADIRVATAARLSASFPYVSPAARPSYKGDSPVSPGQPQYYRHMHVVDGGYFDNSGLCALTEWLDDALAKWEDVWKKANRPSIEEKILVLEIRGRPDEVGGSEKPQRGWLYQALAPVSTMLGVMTSGQEATNVTEFELLQKYWAEKKIKIVRLVFQPDASIYQNERAIPLSWHLRKRDKELIEAAWQYECEHTTNCQAVIDFVGQP